MRESSLELAAVVPSVQASPGQAVPEEGKEQLDDDELADSLRFDSTPVQQYASNRDRCIKGGR